MKNSREVALLPYTSGTTGLPKGCMHTHRTLMANSVGGQWSYSSPEALGLGVVPMFHITGMLYSVLGSAYGCATVVLMPRWDRELAGRLISRHRITHWVCIPTMVIDLFGSPNYKNFDLSSLRSMSGGGAAMPHAVAERLLDEFGPTYFHVAQMTHVTAEEYRAIAPHVSADGLRLDGDVVALLPENSEQVSAAVAELLDHDLHGADRVLVARSDLDRPHLAFVAHRVLPFSGIAPHSSQAVQRTTLVPGPPPIGPYASPLSCSAQVWRPPAGHGQ